MTTPIHEDLPDELAGNILRIFPDFGIGGDACLWDMNGVCIGDHARTCPHCGAPVIATIKRNQKSALIGLAIRLGAALLIGFSFFIFWHFTMGKVLAPLQNMQQQSPPH